MSVATRIRDVVNRYSFTHVAEDEWHALRTTLPDISAATLRKHLLASGLSIDQPWRGVDTGSLDLLEATLRDLAAAYPTHSHLARDEVIQAKDKARFASRNIRAAPEKRLLKSEMVQWMLVWLADPSMFADWVRLRRSVLDRDPSVLGTFNRARPTPL